MRGGERVLEALLALYPEATIHTLVHAPGRVSAAIEKRPIRTSFIQHLPGAPRRFRQYLPLFPAAARQLALGLQGYDLVLATSHCVAVGARPAGPIRHAAYCFTPMRYAWAFEGDYLGRLPAAARAAVRMALAGLRRWDRRAGERAGPLACISHHVAARIRRVWDRAARVIYPPVRTEFFRPADTPPGDYFLCVSALTPYKRLDVAVDAFTRLGWPLVVVGTGPEAARLRRRAGPTVSFLGWMDDARLRETYARCRAFVFPGEEEFGIAPLEAMATGRPVIAYGRGALTETVVEGVSGLFFHEQSPEALVDALHRFEVSGFSPDKVRAQACRFGERVFRAEMTAFVAGALGERSGVRPPC